MVELPNPEFRGAISGSFKFKAEIDQLREDFADVGISILAPDSGWLYLPPQHRDLVDPQRFRPLPTERDLTVRQVEDRFLAAIHRSDFLYLYNEDGYLGLSASFELGYAIALGKPIYAKEPLDYVKLDILELDWQRELTRRVQVMSINEAARDLAERRDRGEMR